MASPLRSAFLALVAVAALSGVDAATSMPGPTSSGNRWIVLDNRHPEYDDGAGYTNADAACITPTASTVSSGVSFPGSSATDEQGIDFCLDYCRAQADNCNFMWVYEGPVGASNGYRCCPKATAGYASPLADGQYNTGSVATGWWIEVLYSPPPAAPPPPPPPPLDVSVAFNTGYDNQFHLDCSVRMAATGVQEFVGNSGCRIVMGPAPVAPPPPSPPVAPPPFVIRSCQDILTSDPTATTGMHQINLLLDGVETVVDVYCLMATADTPPRGWTRITRAYNTVASTYGTATGAWTQAGGVLSSEPTVSDMSTDAAQNRVSTWDQPVPEEDTLTGNYKHSDAVINAIRGDRYLWALVGHGTDHGWYWDKSNCVYNHDQEVSGACGDAFEDITLSTPYYTAYDASSRDAKGLAAGPSDCMSINSDTGHRIAIQNHGANHGHCQCHIGQSNCYLALFVGSSTV